MKTKEKLQTKIAKALIKNIGKFSTFSLPVSYTDELENTALEYDIIVFSHLRWEFVTQRPQHIMKRLAKNRRILFVEEPIGFSDEKKGTAHVIHASDNITVIQPRIAWEEIPTHLDSIVRYYAQQLNLRNVVLWFYSPTFRSMIKKINHSLVVFDCMDELSLFKGASPEHIRHEQELLSAAHIVFTGGKSLYESKKKQHAQTFCFPSSVDEAHFQQAFSKKISIPEDIASIKKPIVGFYGVIDERIDLELLQTVAHKLKHVSFVMIGPLAKISEENLPRAENIHYLGGKKYEELPSYLKAFTIAMMPFALNDATKFISPTKTLEFMAARKPIISTPVYDVVRDYKREVAIIKSADEFVQAIKGYLHESPYKKGLRISLQTAVIKRTSWDKTVQSMTSIMSKVLEKSEKISVQGDMATTLIPST